MNNYDNESDSNTVSNTIIESFNKSVNKGLKEIGKALTTKQAKFNRALFDSFPESRQVKFLKTLTTKEGLTQQQAGNLCGLDQSSVSRELSRGWH